MYIGELSDYKEKLEVENPNPHTRSLFINNTLELLTECIDNYRSSDRPSFDAPRSSIAKKYFDVPTSKMTKEYFNAPRLGMAEEYLKEFAGNYYIHKLISHCIYMPMNEKKFVKFFNYIWHFTSMMEYSVSIIKVLLATKVKTLDQGLAKKLFKMFSDTKYMDEEDQLFFKMHLAPITNEPEYLKDLPTEMKPGWDNNTSTAYFELDLYRLKYYLSDSNVDLDQKILFCFNYGGLQRSCDWAFENKVKNLNNFIVYKGQEMSFFNYLRNIINDYIPQESRVDECIANQAVIATKLLKSLMTTKWNNIDVKTKRLSIIELLVSKGADFTSYLDKPDLEFKDYFIEKAQEREKENQLKEFLNYPNTSLDQKIDFCLKHWGDFHSSSLRKLLQDNSGCYDVIKIIEKIIYRCCDNQSNDVSKKNYNKWFLYCQNHIWDLVLCENANPEQIVELTNQFNSHLKLLDENGFSTGFLTKILDLLKVLSDTKIDHHKLSNYLSNPFNSNHDKIIACLKSSAGSKTDIKTPILALKNLLHHDDYDISKVFQFIRSNNWYQKSILDEVNKLFNVEYTRKYLQNPNNTLIEKINYCVGRKEESSALSEYMNALMLKNMTEDEATKSLNAVAESNYEKSQKIQFAIKLVEKGANPLACQKLYFIDGASTNQIERPVFKGLCKNFFSNKPLSEQFFLACKYREINITYCKKNITEPEGNIIDEIRYELFHIFRNKVKIIYNNNDKKNLENTLVMLCNAAIKNADNQWFLNRYNLEIQLLLKLKIALPSDYKYWLLQSHKLFRETVDAAFHLHHRFLIKKDEFEQEKEYWLKDYSVVGKYYCEQEEALKQSISSQKIKLTWNALKINFAELLKWSNVTQEDFKTNKKFACYFIIDKIKKLFKPGVNPDIKKQFCQIIKIQKSKGIQFGELRYDSYDAFIESINKEQLDELIDIIKRHRTSDEIILKNNLNLNNQIMEEDYKQFEPQNMKRQKITTQQELLMQPEQNADLRYQNDGGDIGAGENGQILQNNIMEHNNEDIEYNEDSYMEENDESGTIGNNMREHNENDI